MEAIYEFACFSGNQNHSFRSIPAISLFYSCILPKNAVKPPALAVVNMSNNLLPTPDYNLIGATRKAACGVY
jgi:hypothetical protein